MLWDTDPERARELFRRAWEAAEIVDAEAAKKRAEEMKRLESEGGPVVVRGGPTCAAKSCDSSAKRDRKLGEEFLKALDEAAEKARTEAAADQRRNIPALASARRSVCNSRAGLSKTAKSNAHSNLPRPHSTP